MPRLDTPRVDPVAVDDFDDAQREIMKPFVAQGRTFNVFTTLVNHPDLFRRWLVFANHILFKSTLGTRDREILILRIGHLADCEYEWRQHVQIARDADMTDAEISAVRQGADASCWSENERALINATDELKHDTHLSDGAWAALAAHYDTRQIMDIVFTVGQYNMLAMALNSLGVQADDGLPETP